MRKKIVSSILISIIIISKIFVIVNATNIKGTNATEKVNNAKKINATVENTDKGTNKANSEAEERLVNTIDTNKSVKESASNKEENKKSLEEAETDTSKEAETSKANTDKNAVEREEYITEDDLIYSDKYLVKGKAIYRIEPKTSIKEFKKNIEIAKGQEIKIYKEEKEVTSGNIGTGMLVRGTNGEEYTLSVIGDITGDGISNQIELTMIIRHLVNLKGWELEGIKKESSDINRRWKNRPSRYNKTNKLHSIWKMGE